MTAGPMQVQRKEMLSFLDFANDYFEHLFDAFNTGNPTCLAKILGVYQVGFRGLEILRVFHVGFQHREPHMPRHDPRGVPGRVSRVSDPGGVPM